MYQVLHDTNNVTDMTAAVTDTVWMTITHPGTRVVGSVAVLLQVQNCSLLFLLFYLRWVGRG